MFQTYSYHAKGQCNKLFLTSGPETIRARPHFNTKR
jgi:hypothetical protein